MSLEVETTELDFGSVALLYARPVGKISDDAEYLRWLDRYRQMHVAAKERGQKLAVIYDLSHSPPLTAQQRKIQGDWNKEIEPLVAEVLVGLAIVAASPIMRGVMTAVFWLKPPTAPYLICGDPHEALHWVFARCDDAKLRVSHVMRNEARSRLITSAARSKRA